MIISFITRKDTPQAGKTHGRPVPIAKGGVCGVTLSARLFLLCPGSWPWPSVSCSCSWLNGVSGALVLGSRQGWAGGVSLEESHWWELLCRPHPHPSLFFALSLSLCLSPSHSSDDLHSSPPRTRRRSGRLWRGSPYFALAYERLRSACMQPASMQASPYWNEGSRLNPGTRLRPRVELMLQCLWIANLDRCQRASLEL